MLRLLLHWILNALALLVVSHFLQGFEVSNVVSAFIAVVVIGLLNATVGLFLKIITLPLGILTLVLSFLLLWFTAWASGKVSQRRHDLSEVMRPDFNVILAASLTLLGLIIGF